MKRILEQITAVMAEAFAAKGYEERFGQASVSNRPDLCQYQCNGAMAAAKQYGKAPFVIAEEIAAYVAESQIPMFSEVKVVKPGFLNLVLSPEFLAAYLNGMAAEERLGAETAQKQRTIVIDYGGANVAKPLHVGHLRSAIIGESVKRICRFAGHNVIGDVHLGDWGLPMGLIITEMKKRNPDWIYFQEDYEGEYPKEAPFTISELEEIYPYASAWSKEHPEYKEEAQNATKLLQNHKRGYYALWTHILNVSVEDLKKNYGNLNVEFDLWKKESDADPYISGMVEKMKADGFAYISEGALVVDVKEETDTKEMPPCMILKSDGSSLYQTTDLATIVERKKLFDPDAILYLTDKRQELHFVQVFRCARKTGLIGAETELTFVGFGTMNGKDGKPFKTRDGGVMRLENLIAGIMDEVARKMADRDMPEEEREKIVKQVGVAALKYGDLSNQASKDYIFDEERFASFEGNTGPYIQYTVVRIKSILAKYEEGHQKADRAEILPAAGETETALELLLARFNEVIRTVSAEYAPHKLCQYIYELADTFNRFYHENHIMAQEDGRRQASWISLIILTRDILVKCLDLLGIEAPDKM